MAMLAIMTSTLTAIGTAMRQARYPCTVRGVTCGDEALRKIVDDQDSLALSRPILDELLSVLARKFAHDREALVRVAVFLSLEAGHEDHCRDALLSDLRYRMRGLGIAAEPEGRYASEKRADIRVSGDGFNVPVEIIFP